MTTHPSILAWRIPPTEEPGGIQSVFSQRVRHNWANEHTACWRRWCYFKKKNHIDYVLCSRRWKSSIHSAKTRSGADCGSDNQLLIVKFRLKLKKVGKTTRLFGDNLNQIPYDYTVEMMNRFKGFDLVYRVPEELWTPTPHTVEKSAYNFWLLQI